VPNRECDLYTRLWCVYEVFAAVDCRVPIRLAVTLARAGGAGAEKAVCSSPHDERSIRQSIESTIGYRVVDRAIHEIKRKTKLTAIAAVILGGLPVTILVTTEGMMRNGLLMNSQWWQAVSFFIQACLWFPMVGAMFWIAKRAARVRGAVTNLEAVLLAGVVVGLAAGTCAVMREVLHINLVADMERQLVQTGSALTYLCTVMNISLCFKSVIRPGWHRIPVVAVYFLMHLAWEMYAQPENRLRGTEYVRLMVQTLRPVIRVCPALIVCKLVDRWGVEFVSGLAAWDKDWLAFAGGLALRLLALGLLLWGTYGNETSQSCM